VKTLLVVILSVEALLFVWLGSHGGVLRIDLAHAMRAAKNHPQVGFGALVIALLALPTILLMFRRHRHDNQPIGPEPFWLRASRYVLIGIAALVFLFVALITFR